MPQNTHFVVFPFSRASNKQSDVILVPVNHSHQPYIDNTVPLPNVMVLGVICLKILSPKNVFLSQTFYKEVKLTTLPATKHYAVLKALPKSVTELSFWSLTAYIKFEQYLKCDLKPLSHGVTLQKNQSVSK